jgi:hypothetical protein
MVSNDARRIEQASAHPCPRCNATAGFVPGPAGLSGWLKAATVGAASVVLNYKNPGSEVEAITTGGLIARCKNCRMQVEICGHCNHANHSSKIPRICANCGSRYSA